jgi:hypothetical protein
MVLMATRQPRRTRRRTPPGAALPRPAAADAGSASAQRTSAVRRAPAHHRTHHVTTDYRYVRRDLTSIAVIGGISLGFIVGMAVYIGAI